uniref:Uncharacterized protein n=1 Tax=Alexandrium catenella TaxID=2925 RepID=A0A7S1RIH0_ALECA
MCRWLQAASSAEPQVLRQLLHVGNDAALWELLENVRCNPPFSELCEAYAQLVSLGLGEDFPALCLDAQGRHAREVAGSRLGLQSCGELWVLMLLLLPPEFRTAVAPELARPWAVQEFSNSSRVLWVEHLGALEADLSRLLQMPGGDSCKRAR